MKADLAKLRALHEAATQYPAWGGWPDPQPSRHGTDHFTIGDAPPFIAAVRREEDAALIAAMHRSLPELLAIAEAVERDEVEYEFEIWQDDAMQAGGTTSTLDAAIGEAAHYRMMYGQDGPVEVKIYERRAISDAAIDRLLTIGTAGHE